MATKVLIDTNILVYALDITSDFYILAQKLLDQIENRELEAFIAEKSLLELAAVLTSKAYNGRIESASIRSSIQYFSDNQLFTILYSNPSVTSDIWRLLFNSKSKANRVFDMALAAIAIEHRIDTIYTKNTKDFQFISELNIIDPLI
jgi:predicted nucleic acid-binding protein